MIGTELLQLLQGDPLAQMRRQMAPNPNPQMPQQPQTVPAPRLSQPEIRSGQLPPGPLPGMSPAPASIGGPPGHFETLPDQAQSPHWVPGPAPGAPQPAAGAPAPSQPQQPPAPPSVAPQSPPDLASLYMRLMQQQRAGSAIDHGLALMASAYAAPGTQGQIMHSMDNQQQDPSTMMNNLVQLQQMQNLQNLPQPGSGGAGTAAGLAPGGGTDGSGAGTKMYDDRTWAMMPPEAKLKAIEAQAQSRMQLQQQGSEEKQKELIDAQDKAPASLQQMSDMDSIANQLKGPMNPALTSILASQTKKMAAEKLLETDPAKEPWDSTRNYVYANMLSSDELAALNQLKKLDAQVYSDAFQSTGSRRTQQEVQNLKGGISTLMNFTQAPDAYMKQFNDFQNNLHKTMANTYGAAGRVDEIPDAIKWDTSDPANPKPMVDSAYLPNGNKYAGRGGQWASNPPPKQGGTQVASADFSKMSSTDADAAFTKLPSGAVFTGPDGQLRKKP